MHERAETTDLKWADRSCISIGLVGLSLHTIRRLGVLLLTLHHRWNLSLAGALSLA